MINKTLKPVLISVSICLLWMCAAHGDLGQKQTKQVMDNGLTVLISEIPTSPVVSTFALVKAGSSTEGKYLGTGISHFVEHMLFKGTHGRGVGEIASRIQAVGGEINAATTRDYTIYIITVPHEHIDVALDILADMLMNATIDGEEVELEREVIFGEMRMRNDDPDRVLHELTYQNIFLRHPYRHPIIGYKSLLAAVTAQDLTDYYRERYVASNTILSIGGRVDTQKTLDKVKEVFRGFRRGRPILRMLPTEPPQASARYYVQDYPTDLTRLTMSFISVSLLHHDLYALDVLANILGQGKSSRLFTDIYKKQDLVHSISAHNHTPIDKGVFNIECLLEDENVEEVLEKVKGHLERIKREGVKPAELEKAKTQVQSYFIYAHQTASSVTYVQAVDEAYTGDPRFSDAYVKGIDRVTLKDVQRVAKKYLVDTAMTTVILRPESKTQENPVKETNIADKPIVKHVLKNGVVVLLRQDDTFPTVSIRVNLNGGVRQEPPDLNGLSQLTAKTWTKGTRRYSANDIAELTDSQGMRLSTFSGRNSFGLELKYLSGQGSEAYELLEELILHPVFPKEDMEEIKGNMRAAIRMREYDISDTTGQALRETLFQRHPFRLNKGGTVETINSIEQEDLVGFYGSFAASRNMVVSVFGDIDPDETLKEIKQIFGSLKDKEAKLRMYSEPPPAKPRKRDLTMDKEQAMVMIGFQGATIDDKDRYGIEVMTTLLGSSFSGRLFNVIRDKMGEAYTLGGNYVPGPDMGFIYFYVLTTEEKTEEVLELIKAEIRALQGTEVGTNEFNDMKTYLKGTFKSSLETNSSLGYTAGLDELYGLGYRHYEDYEGIIDAITADDIRRLATKYLDLEKMATAITKPQKKLDK